VASNSEAGLLPRFESIDFITVSGYRQQYAAIHFEARVERLTFLSNLHVIAEQFGDERALPIVQQVP
jgi:hypothetical protein